MDGRDYHLSPSGIPRFGTPLFPVQSLLYHAPNGGAVRRREHPNNSHQNRPNHQRRIQKQKNNNASKSSHSHSTTKSASSDVALPFSEQIGPRYFCRGCDLHYDYYLNRNKMIGRVPCILPCGHTLCQECINKSLRNNNIECLICHDSRVKQQQYDYNHYLLGHIANSKLAGADLPDVKLCSRKQKTENAHTDGDFMFKCGLDDCRNFGTVSCLNCFKLYCDECDNKIHKNDNNVEIHMRATNEKGHEGHSKDYLKRLEENERQDLEEAYKIVNARIEDLKKNLKTTDDSKKVNNIENEIATRFADIHAKLYLIEKKLRAEARQRSHYENCNEGDTIISTNISAMAHIVQCFDKSCSVACNMKALHAKFMELKGTSIPSKFVYDRGVKLIIDEKIDKLEDFFELVSSSPQMLPLSSQDELDDNSSEADSSTEGLSKTVNRFAGVDQQRNIEPSKEALTVSDETERDAGGLTVYVTHVNSADSFYVQTQERSEHFRKYEKDLKYYIKKSLSGVIKVEINALYLAPIAASSVEWGRVQVLEHLKEQRKWMVIFIDFGQFGIFSRKELKRLDGKILYMEKAFAMKCALYNPSKTQWSEESHEKFKEILSIDKKIFMLRKSSSCDASLVDLFVSDSLGAMISVSDLISGKITANPGMNTQSANAILGYTNQILESTDTFSVGESYDVFMRYVLDPFHVFIHKASYENVFQEMMVSLDMHYKHSECDVYLPVVDSDVVVFYPTEYYGNWHRGRVQNIDADNKHVDVFLVDWGKQVNVLWSDMRKLIKYFQGIERFVICAELADINPKSANGWLSAEGVAATNFLETYCSNSSVLKMLVSESSPLKIALFEKKEEFDENVNAVLVRKDLAICRGPLSTTVEWPLKKNEEDKVDNSEFFPIRKFSDESDDSEEEIEGIKLRVQLVRFVDPYRIYISIKSRKQQGERLFEELQIHYKTQKSYVVNKTWNVNQTVVVYHDVERDYYRGRIEEIKGNKYYVFLLDLGDLLCVKEENLRPILPYFDKTFPNGVLRCHLANIKPAGGTDKWSSTALEWFQRMFKKHTDLFIQKFDNDESKNSLPVTMWYTKVIQGSALEPTTYKFFSIEMKAVRAGLAFQIQKIPRLKKKRDAIEPVINVKQEETFEFAEPEVIMKKENAVRTILQWPPPEPLTSLEFRANVTCVEAKGYIYVRDERLQRDYKAMEEHMKKHFDSLPRAKPFHVYENQMVTILSDGLWYRGSVLEIIDEDTVRVMMVDFGSDHIVDKYDLHRRIMYSDIPVFTRKICLHDVLPVVNKTWTNDNTDTLQRTIPEHSTVVIRTNDNNIPTADIYDENGMCFNDTFVSICNNLYRSNGTSAPLRMNTLEHCTIIGNELQRNSDTDVFSDASTSSGETLHSITNYIFVRASASPGKKIASEIISVCYYDTISLLFASDPSREDEFQCLTQTIQKEAAALEPLADISIGAPCISLFENDQHWYRAQIHGRTVDDEVINVFYVDYGNFESVHLSDIRTIKAEWLHFPAYCSIAHIDYKSARRDSKERLFNLLEEKKGDPVLVEIIRDVPMTVHLYHDGDLLYKRFIENGDVELL